MVADGTRGIRDPANVGLHGVDVSSFQTSFPKEAQIVMVRASYGRRRDSRAVQHVAQARAQGAGLVGLYHFFTDFDPVEQQFETLESVVRDCGLGLGDAVPHIDVEDTTGSGGNPPKAAWCGPLRELASEVRNRWGVGWYMNAADWSLLGRPEWLLDDPQWTPHWLRKPGPIASPGGVTPWLWQYDVGPWNPGVLSGAKHWQARGAVDHDCLIGKPALIAFKDDVAGGTTAEAETSLPAEDLELMRRVRVFECGLSADDWIEIRRERDRLVFDRE